MLNFSLDAKIGDPPGKSKAFSPLCPSVPSMTVSGGILWASLELKQGIELLQKRLLSPSSPPYHNGKGAGWIITILLPALLFKTILLGFFSKFHVSSCWTKV